MSENTPQSEHQNTAPTQGQMYIAPQYYAQQDDEIDLRELFGVLWKGKWWIIGITAIFAIASVFYALSLPNEYKATAIVAPASSDSGSNLSRAAGQLGGLASLAGINLGGGESNDATIAMEIMKTWGFQEDFIKKHNLEVPIFAAIGWNPSTNELVIDDELYDVKQKKWVRKAPRGKTVEPTSWELYEEFSKKLVIAQNKELGLIYISYIHFSPEESRKIVYLLVKEINDLMKNSALKESSQNIDYLEKQVKKTALSNMQEVFYSLVEEQIKKKMLAEVSTEYVFKVISNAKAPQEKFTPRRALICLFGVCLGAALVITFLTGKYLFTPEKIYMSKAR